MVSCEDILSFCDELLSPSAFADGCWNGLQVPGKKEVKKVALGVSASAIFLQQASDWNADLCVVHHGLFWGKVERLNDVISGRLRTLLVSRMGLVAYHLPLDAHAEIGNNVILAGLLGLYNKSSCDIGFVGNLKRPLAFVDFVEKVESVVEQKSVFAENFGTKEVSRVGIISGGASSYSEVIKDSGADTFVFGELKESAFHELRERGLNFVAAGHYATEVFGVRALGDRLGEVFPELEVRFFPEVCGV